MKTKKIYLAIVSVLFMGMWGTMAISKFYGLRVFEGVIAASPLVPDAYIEEVVWALIAFYVIVFVLLAEKRWRIWGIYASTLSIAAFTLYTAGMLIFCKSLPCQSGGLGQNLSWLTQLIIYLLLTLLAVRASRICIQGSIHKNQQSKTS